MPYPLILFLKKVVMVFFRQSAAKLKEMNPLFHQTCFNFSLHGNIKDFFTGIPRARIGDVQWESLATRRVHPSTSSISLYRLLRKREIDDVPGIISAGAAPTAVEEHSSDFVDRNPFILLDLFEVGWRETRLFFELPGKVLLAAVIEHVSDICVVFFFLVIV